MTEEEKHYLLLFLLSCCTIIDSDYEEHKGEKVATFMDTFVTDEMAELILKASKQYLGEDI